MNKFILVTIIFAISYKAAWAMPTVVEIREYDGGLITVLDALLDDITVPTTGSNEDAASSFTAALATTCANTADACTGKGATVKLKVSSNVVSAIQVVASGYGYKAGDTLSVTGIPSASTATDLGILLTVDHINANGLHGGATFATNTLSGGVNGATAGATFASLATTSNGAGVGAIVTVVLDGSKVPTVTVVSAGRGYKVGETLTIAKADIDNDANADMVITLAAADVNSGDRRYPKAHTTPFLSSTGADMAWDHAGPTLTGYYIPLSKSTTYISIVATFSSGTVIPQIGSDSDQTLTTLKASVLLSVKDGFNVLKLVSSEDGTYEMYLVKPESQIKEITTSKRSITIAYTPAAVGEFTCSAFDGSHSTPFTDPTDRTEVKTLSGVITKSTRTNNILVQNMFKSVQMTLNGLTPFTEHEIHCYHAAHGVISEGNRIFTQLGSLTGVSLSPSVLGNGNSPGTITLTFTHERDLVATNTIKLKLYDSYDSVQLTTHQTNCKNNLVVRSGGTSGAILATNDCTVSSSELVITLATGATSTVTSGSSGTQIVIEMTDSTELNFVNNPAALTEVLFDLDVVGHGKITKQHGYTTS